MLLSQSRKKQKTNIKKNIKKQQTTLIPTALRLSGTPRISILLVECATWQSYGTGIFHLFINASCDP